MWLVFLLERVAWLQILSSEDLVKQEDMRSLREEPIVGPRGMIEDRTGRPLAVSVPVSNRWQAFATALNTLCAGRSD